MAKAFRIGTALTALGLIGGLTACASPTARVASTSFNGKLAKSNVGLAMRAQVALESGDHASAVDFAERAVAATPGDAAFRALLGNAYFAAGRFSSAETTYHDSLAINPTQPQVVLKLALVTIAQGKAGAALALLESSRSMLDPSDYGLALALAGQADSAVAALDFAARQVGADARVRQNLALAHALKGDWEMAKVVASQDLAPDQLDARVREWMGFAKPTNSYDQVALLTGVRPAASDPGQPVRLALNKEPSETRLAALAAPVEAVPVAPVAEVVPVAEVATPVEAVAAAVEAPAPVAVAAMAAVVPGYMPAPVAEVAVVEPVADVAPAPALSPRAARFDSPKPRLRAASLPTAFRSSGAVVQLGAYSSRGGVNAAWSRFAAKYPSLRGYAPATARFDSANGTVYRLSVGGFGSHGSAQNFCASLKKAGSACFVRSVAGDAPVRFASR